MKDLIPEGDISRRSLLKGLAAMSALPSDVTAETQLPASESSTQVLTPKGIWNPQLVLFARHLQWTDVENGIEFAKRAGFDGIGWAVRPGAHIDPKDVEKGLPKAVELTQKAGMTAPILTTGILDDQSPRAEAILETMKGVGITSYRAAVFHYDYTQDFRSQMSEMTARMSRLAKLNEKFGVTSLYHTHSYPGLVGGAVWDLWTMIRDFDPKLVAMNYDIGHATVRGGPGWYDSAHAARKFIRGVTLKDFQWVHFPARPFTGRWSPKFCRPGDGIVDFPGFFTYLKEISFPEPIELYFEYELYPANQEPVNLLGTDYGKWKLEVPPEQFLAAMKRDLAFYRDIIRQVNSAQAAQA